RFQSPGRSRATRRSSAANSRRVRSTTFLRMCRMAAGSLVERQHRAGDLPRLHRSERVVDVVEPPPAADHLVEQESPLAVELRSEERRVGKECRSRWWWYYLKKKRKTRR